MFPRFTVDVDGIQVMDRAFNRVQEFISDFRSLWPAVAEEFYKIEGEQFASEGAASASGKWASLSKAYATWKAVRFPNQTILKASTSLFDALTSQDAPGSIFRPTESELVIGASQPYGLDHQRGGGRLPRRRAIDPSEAQKRRLQKAIQVGLVQFVRRQGFNVLEQAA